MRDNNSPHLSCWHYLFSIFAPYLLPNDDCIDGGHRVTRYVFGSNPSQDVTQGSVTLSYTTAVSFYSVFVWSVPECTPCVVRHTCEDDRWESVTY